MGISPTTDKNVIKKAYRKKAFQFHPDRNPSASAQTQFIAITEAYEIVSGIRLASKSKNQSSAESAGPTREERVAAAKERYKKAKQKEMADAAAFYFGLIKGFKWKFIYVFGVVCLCLSALLIIDFFLIESKGILFVENMFYNGVDLAYININNSNYYFTYLNVIEIKQYPVVEVNESIIFNDLVSLDILDSNGYVKSIEPEFTIRGVFPLVPIVLCIPILTYYYKRPTILFTVLYMISLYFIPLVFGFVLLSNWRIFQAFM